MNTTSKPTKRITILGVPIDCIEESDISAKIENLEMGSHQIVLLSMWDLLHAWASVDYRTTIMSASLVLPISKAIQDAARFLGREVPVRYMPFEFSVSLLSFLEKRNKSLYVLGASRSALQKAEQNLKSTFPGLRIVGRYEGWHHKSIDTQILTAIQKTSPTLLLVGTGILGKERWIQRNRPLLSKSIFFWCSDLIEVFAEKHYKPSKKTFDKGLEWLPYLLHKPWQAYRVLLYMWFLILILIERFKSR